MRFGRTTLTMSPNTRMSPSRTGIPPRSDSLRENLTDAVDKNVCLSAQAWIPLQCEAWA